MCFSLKKFVKMTGNKKDAVVTPRLVDTCVVFTLTDSAGNDLSCQQLRREGLHKIEVKAEIDRVTCHHGRTIALWYMGVKQNKII
jgi:hypothetical protein